jgi:hypothetical protein
MKSPFFYHFSLQLFSVFINQNSLFGKFLSVYSGTSSSYDCFSFVLNTQS